MKWTKGKVLFLVTHKRMNQTTAGTMHHGGQVHGWRRKIFLYCQSLVMVEETESKLSGEGE